VARGTRPTAVVVSALLAIGLGPVAPAHAGKTRRVLVVGDSLSVGTRPYLGDFLPGWRVTTAASISRHAFEGPAVLQRYGKGLPPVVFVNLGTNDSPGGVAQFVDSIRRTMKIAGPNRCVVWADIVRPPVGGVSYKAMNRALSEQARHRRNLIKFKWVRMASRHRHWFGPDGVHPTATGYRIRAKAMAHNIRVCRKIALRG
jgi:lysophospholipase L1-like esterase